MPICGIACAAFLFVGAGAVVGGWLGALAAWLLHLRQVRAREAHGAEVVPEDFSSECGVFFIGALLGALLGGGAVVGCALLLVTSEAK